MSRNHPVMIGLLLTWLVLGACTQPALPTGPGAPAATSAPLQEEQAQGHGMELHQAGHGGQVGMTMGAAKGGADFHIEIVSDKPGQYQVYLSDANREPVSPEGYTGTLALVNPDGSEIASIPLHAMAAHLMAQGGPADVSQADVRITLEGPDLTDVLEMEFTITYE
jgi:hypothetical protein